MSKKEKIHRAYKLPNGVQVMISDKIANFLDEKDIDPSKMWTIGKELGLCINPIDCKWNCIQVMTNVSFGEIGVAADISLVDDIWCICPEGGCPGLIRVLEPGIAVKDPPIYISLEEIAKKIPANQRKAFTKMMEEIEAK